MSFWQQLYFGVSPDLDMEEILSVCEPFAYVSHVACERASNPGRRYRWLQLLGGEHDRPDDVFCALARAATTVVVVARMKYGSWLVRLLEANASDNRITSARSWRSADFYLGGPSSSAPPDNPETIEQALLKLGTPADAKAIDSPAGGFRVWQRSGDGRFSESSSSDLPDVPCALFWDGVADWCASEDDDDDGDTGARDHSAFAANGDYAQALAALDGDPTQTFYHYNRACYLARLGRNSEALAELGTEVRQSSDSLNDIFFDADLADLRDDPRFAAWVTTELAHVASCDERFLEPVEEMDLSVRTANTLQQLRIATVGDLTRHSEADLLKSGIVGGRTLAELRALVEAGLPFGSSPSNLGLSQWRRAHGPRHTG